MPIPTIVMADRPVIVTLTMNPALDTTSAQRVGPTDKIRCHGARHDPGGGGQRFPAISMRAGSGVGAGDAMVAAITVGLTRGWSLTKSVRLGIAADAAMLLTPGTAACSRNDVERLIALVGEPADIDIVRH